MIVSGMASPPDNKLYKNRDKECNPLFNCEESNSPADPCLPKPKNQKKSW